MQNEPNLFDDRNNATCFTTRGYASKRPTLRSKKQSQSNPNEPNVKMGKMTIRTATPKAYANEQRTTNNKQRTLFKTNPIKPNSPAAKSPFFARK
jgi:hypothetical protein